MNDARLPPPWRMFGSTRPDHIALTSWLHGGPLAAAVPFRFVQFDCGTGANVLALAHYHRESVFIGVDPRAAEIETATRNVAALGLDNARFAAAPFTDLAAAGIEDGSIDYVVAMQSFTWLSDDGRRQLLTACRRSLGAQGVAIVGIDLLPGWKLVEMVRYLLPGSAESWSDTSAAVAAVRQRIGLLHALLETSNNPPYAQLVGTMLAELAEADADTIQRYYFDDAARPTTVNEFVRLAAACGLHYVADAGYGEAARMVPAPLAKRLDEIGVTGIEREQLIDVALGRARRTAILCRSDVIRPNPPTPRVLQAVFVGTRSVAMTPNPRLQRGVEAQFGTDAGLELRFDDPLIKAALLLLEARKPGGMRLGELINEARAHLQRHGVSVELAAGGIDAVVHAFIELHQLGAVELRLREPGATSGRSLHRLATLETSFGPSITTPYHTLLQLDPLGHRIAVMLDGTRDLEAIVAALKDEVLRGEVNLEHNGVSLREPGRVEGHLREHVARVLANFQAWGLTAAT